MAELNIVHFSMLFTSTFKDMSSRMGYVSLRDTCYACYRSLLSRINTVYISCLIHILILTFTK